MPCDPLPPAVTHPAPSILAAESQRLGKGQLHPVTSRLCAFRTIFTTGLFFFFPPNQQGSEGSRTTANC